MSLSVQPIDERAAVAGQLQPGDMKEVAAAGFVAVVNNRPDGEALFGQPRTTDLRRAAEAAGLVFHDLPFSGTRASPEQVRAMIRLLADSEGSVLAFCNSGMRSALLWAAATVASGRPLEEVLRAAERAGQNLAPARETLASLAASALQD